MSFRLTILFLLLLSGTASAQQSNFDVARIDRARVLKAANQYLKEQPITITASTSPRSAGGIHDFFSEGDYWWPDPANLIAVLTPFQRAATKNRIVKRKLI